MTKTYQVGVQLGIQIFVSESIFNEEFTMQLMDFKKGYPIYVSQDKDLYECALKLYRQVEFQKYRDASMFLYGFTKAFKFV